MSFTHAYSIFGIIRECKQFLFPELSYADMLSNRVLCLFNIKNQSPSANIWTLNACGADIVHPYLKACVHQKLCIAL